MKYLIIVSWQSISKKKTKTKTLKIQRQQRESILIPLLEEEKQVWVG